MDALLLACSASAFFMTGVALFVQVVHYPLFSEVGSSAFASCHERHSSLTTWVVLPPMAVELATAWALVLDPPGGQNVITLIGAALATATWALTALSAVPAHRALGTGPDARQLRRLLRANALRLAAWVGHSGVCLALLASG